MIRRHVMALRLALMAADALIATLVFAVVSLVRIGDGDVTGLWSPIGVDARLAAGLFAIAWVSALWFMGLYRLRARWRLATEARDIAKVTVIVAVLTLSTLFVLKQEHVSRLFLALLFLTQPLVTLAGRTALRAGFGALRRRGRDTRYMLVAGAGQLAQDFADRVEARADLGIRVIGHLAVPGDRDRQATRQVLGTIDEIEAVLHSHVVDEVAICLPTTFEDQAELIGRLAADEGKTVRIPMAAPMVDRPSTRHEEFEGYVVQSLIGDDQRELGRIAKRAFDIVGAVAGLVVLSPLLLVTAAVIKARDGSTVLFRQTRVGLHGRPFTIYKFRTMTVAEDSHTVKQATRNNSRVTAVGELLRKLSLDELPQFLNILKGDMSFVGPRPHALAHDAYYGEHIPTYADRFRAKPGLTGLAQVNGLRGEIRDLRGMSDRIAADNLYIESWSLGLDIAILAKTAMIIFSDPQAY